jgi:hypothetical protein
VLQYFYMAQEINTRNNKNKYEETTVADWLLAAAT